MTNAEFSTLCGKALQRPSFFTLPAFVVKLVFGEMGEKLLLSGKRVYPKRLLETGFTFQYPEMANALEKILA